MIFTIRHKKAPNVPEWLIGGSLIGVKVVYCFLAFTVSTFLRLLSMSV